MLGNENPGEVLMMETFFEVFLKSDERRKLVLS